MNFPKICVAFGFGFAVCYFTMAPRSVKANSGLVRVKQAEIGGTTNPIYDVIGFSCTGSGNDVQCFIATQ